jgi:hypothetical protein
LRVALTPELETKVITSDILFERHVLTGEERGEERREDDCNVII